MVADGGIRASGGHAERSRLTLFMREQLAIFFCNHPVFGRRPWSILAAGPPMATPSVVLGKPQAVGARTCEYWAAKLSMANTCRSFAWARRAGRGPQLQKAKFSLKIKAFGGEEGIRTLDTALDRITV